MVKNELRGKEAYTTSVLGGEMVYSDTGDAVGFQIADTILLTMDEWLAIGREIRHMHRWSNFALGDWYLAGEHRFGEVAAQIADEFEWGSLEHLSNVISVSRRVPFENREPRLTWSHHRVVTKFELEEQKSWLDAAKYSRWTVKELTENIKLATQTVLDGEAEQLDEPYSPAEGDLLQLVSQARDGDGVVFGEQFDDDTLENIELLLRSDITDVEQQVAEQMGEYLSDVDGMGMGENGASPPAETTVNVKGYTVIAESNGSQLCVRENKGVYGLFLHQDGEYTRMGVLTEITAFTQFMDGLKGEYVNQIEGILDGLG